MLNGIRLLVIQNGLFLFLTILKFVHQAPILLPAIQGNMNNQSSGSMPIYEIKDTLNSTQHKSIHLLKVSRYNFFFEEFFYSCILLS